MKIEHRFKIAFIFLVVTVFIATIFYNAVEGWGLLDSLYFAVSTATTVGLGDLVPTTPGSRLFTTFYMAISTGLAVYTIALIAHHRILINLKTISRKIKSKQKKKPVPKS